MYILVSINVSAAIWSLGMSHFVLYKYVIVSLWSCSWW